jgi:hypothetical protein
MWETGSLVESCWFKCPRMASRVLICCGCSVLVLGGLHESAGYKRRTHRLLPATRGADLLGVEQPDEAHMGDSDLRREEHISVLRGRLIGVVISVGCFT